MKIVYADLARMVRARHVLRRNQIGYTSWPAPASADDPDGPQVTMLVIADADAERAAAVLTESDLMGTVAS